VQPATGAWTKRQLHDQHVDFPSINRSISGKPYRYTYCATSPIKGRSGPLQGLVKVDVSGEREPEVWLPQPQEFLGEASFCPRAGSGPESAEDDGYIVSFLLDGRSQRSDIVVFDAQKIADGPICRLRTQSFLPHALHGSFSPELVPDQAQIEAAWSKKPTSL
ncbi:unnamed protein product, partial [Polarella glacialis]